MIMGQDSSPTPPRSLDEGTIESVRAALVRHLRDSAVDDAGALRDALHRMANEAHRKSILPEHLLITLKEIWYALPEVRVKENGDQTRLLQRVVSMCIREYFEERS